MSRPAHPRRPLSRPALLVWTAALSACVEPLPLPPERPAPAVHRASAELRACQDAGRALTSIDDALALLNELPRPVDGPCFVAALPRPLRVVASHSFTSAQPAESRRSPRIFLLGEPLVISVVPEGQGSLVVEFGEFLSSTRSLKGEIPLPVTAPLPSDTPYAHVLYQPGLTTCGFCHAAEEPSPLRPGAYGSAALRPHERELVPVSELRESHEACVEAEDVAGACAMFHALFDFGEVEQGAFSPELPTFGG